VRAHVTALDEDRPLGPDVECVAGLLDARLTSLGEAS
jgi:histidine ammonia-lyase